MSGLARWRAILQPIEVDGDSWWPYEHTDPVADWRPRRLRFASVVLRRIAELGASLSLRHAFNRTNSGMRQALMAMTTEAEWFKKMPTANVCNACGRALLDHSSECVGMWGLMHELSTLDRTDGFTFDDDYAGYR